MNRREMITGAVLATVAAGLAKADVKEENPRGIRVFSRLDPDGLTPVKFDEIKAQDLIMICDRNEFGKIDRISFGRVARTGAIGPSGPEIVTWPINPDEFFSNKFKGA